MRYLYAVLIVMLFAFSANGQYSTVVVPSGSAVYGGTTVTVTPSGSGSIYGTWCASGPYYIGSSGPGSFEYDFSPSVKAVRIIATAMNNDEVISVSINGTPYTMTSANFTPFPGSCSSCVGEITGGILTCLTCSSCGEGGGGQLDIAMCGITSCVVSTNGLEAGTVFTFMFSDSGNCFSALNNHPCKGDSLRLLCPGDSTGCTYLWSGPGGFASTAQNPFIYPATYADSGSYRIIKNDGTTIDTAYTFVHIKYKPIITASSNAPLCQGGANTLLLTSGRDTTGETFSWTGPSGFGAVIEDPTISGFVAADTGIYTVYANLNGCKDTATTHVILSPVPPPPTITGDTFYCTGQTAVPFTVTGQPGSTMLWYTASTGGTGTATAPLANTGAGNTTTYWVSETVAGCESFRASITVTVVVTPAVPVVTGTSVYCQFYTYIPPVATGTNILWYDAATGGSGLAAPPTVSTAVAGTFTIYTTQSDSGCTSARKPFVITVNPKPVPPVITDSPGHYCPGEVFVPFKVISGSNILWYNAAASGSGSTAAPAVSTVLPLLDTVWASQTLLGCESDRASTVVTVYDSVRSSFNYSLKYGCKADTVVFNNTSFQTNRYLWAFGDGRSSITANPVHVYTAQGTEHVELFSSSAYCTDSSFAIINHIHPLHAAFTSDNTIICQGSSFIFTNASVGTTPTYLWDFGDGSLVSNTINATHTYPNTGVYKVIEVVTDFVPCRDTAYETVYVDSASPVHIALTDGALCRGTSVTIGADYSQIGNMGIVWYMGNGDTIKGSNPVVYSYDTTGIFQISAKVLYRACPEATTSHLVTIEPAPYINLGGDRSICKGSDAITIIDMANAGNANAKWMWSTGETGSGITVTGPGEYDATVTIDGCSASGSVNVSNDCYLNIPNVFTPNGDGLNDYFDPRQYLTKGLTTFSMNVYDRWGTLLFQANSLIGSGWDGKFNGVEQPEGVYVYMIDATFKDGQKEHHQGNLTLLK